MDLEPLTSCKTGEFLLITWKSYQQYSQPISKSRVRVGVIKGSLPRAPLSNQVRSEGVKIPIGMNHYSKSFSVSNY